MPEDYVIGDRADSTKRPSRKYADGRECAHEQCEATLSIYNPGKFCSLHTNQRDRKDESGKDRT